MTHIPESIAAVAVALLAYRLGVAWLTAWKRRNDLADRFQAYERATEGRILNLELSAARIDKLDGAHNNLLAAHERLFSRVVEIDDTTRKALSDLATKWVAEVQQIKTTQSAAFMQTPAITNRRFQP